MRGITDARERAREREVVWVSWDGGDGLVKIPRAGGAGIDVAPSPFGSPRAVDFVLDAMSVYFTEAAAGMLPSVIKTIPK